MMSALARLQQNAAKAESLIGALQAQLSQLTRERVQVACRAEKEMLIQENQQLRADAEQLKQCLCALETQRGVKQVPLPNGRMDVCSTLEATPSPAVKVEKEAPPPATVKSEKPAAPKKEKKPKAAAAPAAAEPPVDVSRLDMRVGRIASARRHPDADGLYIEEVEVGEERARTVVSGLVAHVPLDALQGRRAVFLLNLKPAKMRGVLSEGMIMCASTPDTVEILEVPAEAAVGDRVTVDAFPGVPDAQLNPKKKVWEAVAPDLRVSATGEACYKGAAWRVAGAACTAATLRDAPIK